MATRTETEEVTIVDGLALRLSFEPDAIRQHFEDDDEYAFVADLTVEQLQGIGESALTDDQLYRTFHEVLVAAVNAEVVRPT